MKKKILMILAMLSLTVAVNASNSVTKSEDGTLYTINGTTITYFSFGLRADNLKNKDVRSIVEAGLKEKICSNKDMRLGLEKAGIKYHYIMIDENNTVAAIFIIDNCN